MTAGPPPRAARAAPASALAGLSGLVALLALVVGGCSVLPVWVPDLSRRDLPAARVQGASGPLSAARSRAALAALQPPTSGTATTADAARLQRHLALEQAIAGTPLTSGNRVQLLRDGPATFRAMLQAIAGAQDHVNLETYILDDDEVGQAFADALIERQQAGVQVQVMHDSAGTLGTPAPYFQRLTAAGVRVLPFNPVNPLQARGDWSLNQRDHRKLLILDGRTAFIGGVNISSVHSGGSSRRERAAARAPWRDTDLQLAGPVVAELQRQFLASWATQQGPTLPARQWFPPLQAQGPTLVRVIASSPDDAYSAIYLTLLTAIDAAQVSVRLTNAYFVPDPQLLAALVAAAARGVQVTLVLPGQTDSWLTYHAGRASYEVLLKGGVQIVERQGALLHAKTALVDGLWATVGSTNLDWRSFLHNHELDAVVLGPEFGLQLQALFDDDLAHSQPVTLDAWQRRGPLPRLKEALAKVWEYWL